MQKIFDGLWLSFSHPCSSISKTTLDHESRKATNEKDIVET